MFEVEVKFAVPDPAAILRHVAALGAEFGPAVTQEDTYYAHPQRDFATTDEALRIRRSAGPPRLTYKGPKIDTETKTRRELELTLSDAAGHAEMLELLGFREVAAVRKRRQTARLERAGRAIEVCFDEVEQLGTFVELETGAAAEQVEEARSALLQLAAELGLENSQRRGYLDLLLDRER